MNIPYRCATRRAFTLVELLSVIAIVGILSTILMVAIGRIRSQANKTECANNLRQIGMLIQLYTQDNNGRLPGPLRGGQDARYDYGKKNTEQLIHYLADYTTFTTTNEEPPRAQMFLCPAFVNEISETNARCYEVRISKLEMTNGQEEAPFGYPSGNAEDAADPPKILSRIADPSRQWMIQDLDQIGTPGYRGSPLAPVEPVHGNVRNTLFFDGHVEALEVTQ